MGEINSCHPNVCLCLRAPKTKHSDSSCKNSRGAAFPEGARILTFCWLCCFPFSSTPGLLFYYHVDSVPRSHWILPCPFLNNYIDSAAVGRSQQGIGSDSSKNSPWAVECRAAKPSTKAHLPGERWGGRVKPAVVQSYSGPHKMPCQETH